jgi:hypothetical protein
MKIVTKKSTWKHITFMTPKIGFMDWAQDGVEVRVKDEVFQFKTKDELHALHISLNGSFHGDDTCYITVNELKSIYTKSKRKEKIQLLNGDIYDKDKLLEKMYNDSFYYGELGKYALSSSAIKSLIDSP